MEVDSLIESLFHLLGPVLEDTILPRDFKRLVVATLTDVCSLKDSILTSRMVGILKGTGPGNVWDLVKTTVRALFEAY